MQIRQMNQYFLQIYLPKPNQQEALASQWMQIKQSLCVLNEKDPSPH